MSLAPYLNSVSALFRKLEREFYRAFQSRERIHKSDHFLNFCITAHAMRDYYIESLEEPSNPTIAQLYQSWNAVPALVAVQEIANSSKHFTLRERHTRKQRIPKTRGVRVKTGVFVDVIQHGPGGHYSFMTVKAPDIMVRMSDGAQLDMFTFMDTVAEYWYGFLKGRGLVVRRQGVRRLREAGT